MTTPWFDRTLSGECSNSCAIVGSSNIDRIGHFVPTACTSGLAMTHGWSIRDIFEIIVDVFSGSLNLAVLNLFFDFEFFRENSIFSLGRRLFLCLPLDLEELLHLKKILAKIT